MSNAPTYPDQTTAEPFVIIENGSVANEPALSVFDLDLTRVLVEPDDPSGFEVVNSLAQLYRSMARLAGDHYPAGGTALPESLRGAQTRTRSALVQALGLPGIIAEAARREDDVLEELIDSVTPERGPVLGERTTTWCALELLSVMDEATPGHGVGYATNKRVLLTDLDARVDTSGLTVTVCTTPDALECAADQYTTVTGETVDATTLDVVTSAMDWE